MGRTRVWVTASVEDRVPMHRRGSGHGWVTAEESMPPRATLDLDYAEDFLAETDMNVVMIEDGRFIELQTTAEKDPLGRQQLDELVGLAGKGIRELITYQKRPIAGLG